MKLRDVGDIQRVSSAAWGSSMGQHGAAEGAAAGSALTSVEEIEEKEQLEQLMK